ncbi:unnamed protein product [Mytilus edulis]|uniref:Uncharacterized protein n=1 Tax=Mytilus edulis TaxID=6550 RepID=A0A8S3R5D4_MYTED|nr:unnamed protein product [Mytilus edulis]
MKTCVKPASTSRRAPTMYLTSDTDCDIKDDCDRFVDNSYPIKLSVGQKDNSNPIKSGGQKDNSYPIKSGGQKDNFYPIKSGRQKDNSYPIKLSGGQKDNSYPIKSSGGQKDNSYPIKLSGGQKNHINEKLTSISSIKSESSQVTLCSVIKETSGTEVQLKPLSKKHNMEENFHYFKQNSGPISTSDILTDWQRLHKSVQEQFQKLKN